MHNFFHFSKSIFQPASWKYISNVFFRFRNISEWCFEPKHQISIFKKKLEVRFLQYICLLAQKLPAFLPRSSCMMKPLLGLCRVDPGDGFTYVSRSRIMSTFNFRISEEKNSKFNSCAYFLKGNFKALPEKLFSAEFQPFSSKVYWRGFCLNFPQRMKEKKEEFSVVNTKVYCTLIYPSRFILLCGGFSTNYRVDTCM